MLVQIAIVGSIYRNSEEKYARSFRVFVGLEGSDKSRGLGSVRVIKVAYLSITEMIIVSLWFRVAGG